MLVAALSVCLAQVPFDFFPPLSTGPQEMQLHLGALRNSTSAAAAAMGPGYLVAWKDGRRRTPDTPARASVFMMAVSPDAGLPAEFEVPQSVGHLGPELHLVATNSFALLVASVPANGSAQLMGWEWTDGGLKAPVVIASNFTTGLTAAAANDNEALVTWVSGGQVMHSRFPSQQSGPLFGIDAGLNALTAGGSDAGFVVAWRTNPGNVQALRLGAGSPTSFPGAPLVQALSSSRHELVATIGTTVDLYRWESPTWLPSQLDPLSSPMNVVLASAPELVFGVYRSMATLEARAWNPVTTTDRTIGYPIGPGVPLALATQREAERALLVVSEGQNLKLSELTLLRSSSLASSGMRIDFPTLPNLPRAQRSPGVVWFDPLSTFVLAWDEELPNHQFELHLAQVEPGRLFNERIPGRQGPEGARPQLLRSPLGTRFALSSVSSSTRMVSALGLDAGLVIGPQLTSLRPMPFSALGDETTLQWSSSGLIVSADTSPSPVLSVAEQPPRCVARAGGKFWFATNEKLHAISDQLGPSPAAPAVLVGDLLSACTETSLDRSDLLHAASLTDGGFRMSTIVASGAMATANEITTRPGPVTVAPVLAPVDGGVIAAWATPAGVQVAFVAPPNTFIPGAPMGGQDVATLSIASNPRGEVLVAWDSFDPSVKTRRVQYRFLRAMTAALDAGSVGPADAGTVLPVDAGSVGDGGFVDAGFVDAGFVDAGFVDAGFVDAGFIDAGFVDAGFVDAGSVDAGDAGSVGPGDAGSVDGGDAVTPTPDVTFIPVCGCRQADAAQVLAMLALLVLTRRRARD